ncbi:MAG TPA: hypothetical protein VGR48_17305 [Terriglobales bacterium]|nr:hypothetical protein [Terriglobales bacterium]
MLERRRISVVDGKIKGHAQPYHFAREQSLTEAKKYIARCAAASLRLAQTALGEVVEQLSREHRVTGAAVLLASGRPLPELERILASHPLIHTAEGEFFRQAFSEACEALSIPVARIRERELKERAQTVFKKSAASLPEELAVAAKHLGPPWSQDQKSAALAAAVVLGGGGTLAQF